jgi:peptidoglycan/LPS O-acetylase OafA/YrhL
VRAVTLTPRTSLSLPVEDVFFVLSGYLMTRSIRAQLSRRSFSYAQFLARRFWRLYPALLCSTAATLGLSYAFLSGEHAAQVARSAIASTFSVSNLLFMSEEGYFGTASALKPLLHTWSLSVEWQFYVIWPLTLAVASHFSRVTRPVWPLSALCFASFAYGISIASSIPQAAFFMLPGRVFEFGLGALAVTSLPTAVPTGLGNVMSTLGTGMILLSFTHLNSGHGAPALIALPALLGALLVIASPSHAVANRVYTSAAFDYLGKISYSAYLIHWPVFVFFHNIYEHSAAPWEVEVAVVAAMMITSALMYHCVEDKFRAARRPWQEGAILGLTALVLIASADGIRTSGWSARQSPRLGSSTAALTQMGMLQEFRTLTSQDFSAQHSGPGALEQPRRRANFGYVPRHTAKRVSSGDRFDALVIGDSFAAPLAGAFHELASERNMTFVLTSRNSCTPFLDAASMDPGIRDYPNPTNNPAAHTCKATVRREMLDLAKTANAPTVFLIGDWASTAQMGRAVRDRASLHGDRRSQEANGRPAALSPLEETVAVLVGMKKRVVVIGMVPGAHFNVRACFAATGPLAFMKRCPARTSLKRLDEGNMRMRRRLLVRRAISSLMLKSPVLRAAQVDGRLAYIDPFLSFCNDEAGVCQTAGSTGVYYYDDSHLTKNGSLLLKSDIGRSLPACGRESPPRC